MIRRLVFCVWLSLIPVLGHGEVIVHPAVSVEAIPRQYLISIYTMRTRAWPDGLPIRVFILPASHPQHQLFVKETLGLFPYQLKKIWDRQAFSGASQLPHTVKTVDEMYERVRNTPGAIGYVMQQTKGGQDVELLEVK